MQVMVLEQDQNLQAHIAGALMEKGFQVICVESIGAAENFIRLDFIDVLVMGERVGGRLSHSLALLAECRNPLVSAILLTDRTGPSLEEIFDLIPSIYGILGRKISPDIVAQIVLASTLGQTTETAQSRLSSRWAEADANPSVIAIGPEVSEFEESEPEVPADDMVQMGLSDADLAEIDAYEAELTACERTEMVHADVEIIAGDFTEAGLFGPDPIPADVTVAMQSDDVVNVVGVAGSLEMSLPLLVLTAPHMVAVDASVTDRAAEEPAAYSAEPVNPVVDHSLPDETQSHAIKERLINGFGFAEIAA